MSSNEVFKCTLCGDCCKGYGGTYVTTDDIRAIADYIDEEPESFIEKFCTTSGRKQVLSQKPDGYCVFWDRVCTIHPVKPRMCRAWPYIESVLVDVQNWYSMGSMCPGIRKEVAEATVRKAVEAMLPAKNLR
ncbi:MAG: YkgJ family cysteine cluster protein [Desulfobacterales bacterium]|nr:YkgJ family cysteine cluster protein [Desulfobacterales bacterium]